MTINRDQGDNAETRALHHLQERGLTIVERNYYSRQGEIDLVMLDAGNLVFVEVRLRNNTTFGSAAESVTRKKQLRIIQAARHFLQQRTQWANHACRFDVVAISNKPKVSIDWIKDAFQPT